MTTRSTTAGGAAPTLPSDVAEALAVPLGAEDAVHRALRLQVPRLRATGRYSCGYGTTYFDLDTEGVTVAPLPAGTVVAAEAQLYDTAEDRIADVLTFARNGWPARPEVCSWSDEPVTLTATLRMLRS
ncbi:hypothetical protein [Streptomyces sp. NBC_01244]|uniref:hypothetical protein n=1 Tax=Streptomyces sp. NBC_01244 TaxID=2903797 RepID=UPI002E14BFA5|nr:hypothetical protein OG247_19185 [Streptomyces sp. NBC_01244]